MKIRIRNTAVAALVLLATSVGAQAPAQNDPIATLLAKAREGLDASVAALKAAAPDAFRTYEANRDLVLMLQQLQAQQQAARQGAQQTPAKPAEDK